MRGSFELNLKLKIKKRTRYTCTRIIIAIFPKNIFPWINTFWPVPCGLGGMVIFTSAGSEMRNGGRVPCTGVGKGGKSRLRNAWASFQGLWSLGKFPGGREMRRQTNGKESRERDPPSFPRWRYTLTISGEFHIQNLYHSREFASDDKYFSLRSFISVWPNNWAKV